MTQEGTGLSKVDLLQAIRDPDWSRDVFRHGRVQYEYHMPRRQDLGILAPTASSVGSAAAMSGTHGGLGGGITLHTTPIPVTFMGTKSSVVRFDTWDFAVFHSFEIEFRTFEPNGVLFFV